MTVMNKRLLFAALLLAVAAPLYADFNSIERALTVRLGKPTYIPLLGLVRLGTWVVHPKGVHDIQLAVYEGPRNGFDSAEIERIVSREVPKGYSPLVRTRARNGECALIYARPRGDRVELLVVAHDAGDGDTTLIRVDVDAVRVAKEDGETVEGAVARRETSIVGRATAVVGCAKAIVGRAKLSVGRAKPIAGRAKPSVGRAKLSVRRAKLSVRRAKLSVRRAKLSVGREKLSVGRAKLSVHRENLSARREFASVRREFVGACREFVGACREFVGACREFVGARREFVGARRELVSA